MSCTVGFLKLDTKLLWKTTVLGKIYKVKIGKYNYFLHFPLMPECLVEYDEKLETIVGCSLKAPKILNNVKNTYNLDSFGFIVEYDERLCKVNYLVLSSDGVDGLIQENLLQYTDNWLKNFLDILRLSTNNVTLKPKVDYLCDSMRIYNMSKNMLSPTSTQNSARIPMILYNDVPVDNKTTTNTISLLNHGISFLDSYKYYLSAKNYYYEWDFRTCVLNCATAAEIVIINRIMIKRQTASHRKSFKQNQGLKYKFNWLRSCGENIPIDINLITNPRNKAIHSGNIISLNEAKACLNETKKLLDLFEKFY